MKSSIGRIALCFLFLGISTTADAQDERLGKTTTRQLMSTFNQAETLSSNVQKMIAEPMPDDIAGTPAKAAAWRKQTEQIAAVHLDLLGYIRKLNGVLRDSVVTRTELTSLRASCSQIIATELDNVSGIPAMARRREVVVNTINSLCNNEVIEE